MSFFADNNISATTFSDPRIQATEEKRWADLSSEEKKEIAKSIALVVASCIPVILLLGCFAAEIAVGVTIAPVAFCLVPPTSLLLSLSITLLINRVLEAKRTINELLPSKPAYDTVE